MLSFNAVQNIANTYLPGERINQYTDSIQHASQDTQLLTRDNNASFIQQRNENIQYIIHAKFIEQGFERDLTLGMKDINKTNIAQKIIIFSRPQYIESSNLLISLQESNRASFRSRFPQLTIEGI